jgi:DNA-binding NarL/FixJ family response regulator
MFAGYSSIVTTADARAVVSILLLEDDLCGRALLDEVMALRSDLPPLRMEQVNSIAACRAALAERSYDVLIADLGLPDGNGIDAIRFARRQSPPPIVLVLSGLCDDVTVLAAIGAGASGYVSKFDAPEDIARAICLALGGGASLSPAIAARVVSALRHNAIQGDVAALTPRERQVLELSARGYSYPQIGELIGIATSTVYTYSRQIYEKLHVSSLAQALYEARVQGLL